MPFGLTRLIPTRGRSGGTAPSSDASGLIYSATVSSKVGKTAILYANGTQISTATVDGTSKATWTLSSPLSVGTFVFWYCDGIIGGLLIIAPIGATVPAAPTITLGAGSGQVTITWTDGSNGGATITSHKLYRGTVSGSRTLIGTISTASPYVDTGLTNGTTYYYSLSAVNSVGEGLQSAQVSATPAAAVSAGDPNRLMYGSTRSGWPGVKTAPAAGQECRVSKSHFRTPDYAVTKVAPVLVNFGMDRTGPVLPETDTGNAVTIYKITLVVGSNFYTLPYTGTIADGATVVVPAFTVPSAIPPRTDCFWIIGDSVAAGLNSPGGLTRQSNNGEQVARAASFTDGWFDGSVAIPNGNNIGAPGGGALFAPVTTLTNGWDGRAVVDIEGDSMMEPANDIGNFAGASGVQGWGARGCDSADNGTLRLPHANFAVGGTRPTGMSSRATGKFLRRGATHDAMRAANAALNIMGSDGKGALPFTRILSEHINNDASGGNTTSQLQAIMDAYWAFLASEFPDAPIVQTGAMTANYSNTSANTDPSQWTTLEGQAPRTTDTVPTTGARWIVSDGYLNNKPAALAATIDQTDYLMSRTERKWLPRAFNATLTADYTSGLTIQLSAAPQIGEALVVGAGTASAAKPQFVTAVSGTGPYTVTLFAGLVVPGTSSTVATQTAGVVVKAAGTGDGLHASPLVHIELAAAIVAAKTAGKFPSAGPIVSTNKTAEAVGTLTRSGVQVYQLASGASISGTNAGHFAVDANGVVTVSSAGQTAALNGGPYTLTVTGDSAVTSLAIPTEAGTLDIYDTVDAASLTAAVNYAYSTAPSGTDWVVRPRAGSASTATVTDGIRFNAKIFGGANGAMVDPNKGVVDETAIVRNAKASITGGSLTIKPRVVETAKIVGFASTTTGAGLALWGCSGFIVDGMVIEATAGADGSDISVPDRSDDIYPAQANTWCVYIRMDGATTYKGNHIFRNCVIGAPDAAPYTRYPIGANVRSGGNVVFEDCRIKNTLVGLNGSTFEYMALRRSIVRNFLLDSVDLFNNNYSGTPAFAGTECFYGSSDNVFAAPNIGPQFSGAHCDGTQAGAPNDTRHWRLSMHFDIHLMDADENVKATQTFIIKDVPAGIFIRGRISNIFGHMSTLNGAVLAGMDPDDRLVLKNVTFFRSTVADPGSSTAGVARITVEKALTDATRHGPLIINSIFGAFYDTTGATKSYTADPVPGGSGSRTLTGGGTVLFQNNFYLDQRTQNTSAGNSAPEVFSGLANAAYVANRGYQYAYDYTSYDTIRASATTLFAVNSAGPAAGRGASLAALTPPATGSVFSAGTWNDTATWSDTDTWVD